MPHTPKERVNSYKEQHEQFQPKRTDEADWDEAVKETEAKPRKPKMLTMPHKI
jgi:hypothetical protein